MAANDFRCPGDPEDYPGHAAILAYLEPRSPEPVDYNQSRCEKEEAYRMRRGDYGQGCSRCGHRSPQHAQPQPLQIQPPLPHRFQPRLASDDDSDDFETTKTCTIGKGMSMASFIFIFICNNKSLFKV
jgi:hypothetical protein